MCFRARAIIAAKIDKRLFAFEDGGRSDFVRLRAVGCDIRTIAAPRQADFHRARGITLRLRPEQSQAFQPSMGGCFAPAAVSWGKFATCRVEKIAS
jgi:hypothetical protein